MTAAPQPLSENALQKERRLFGELFDRFINSLLNWLFDLRPERAQRRMRNLAILFPLVWFLVCLHYYPLGLWIGYLQKVLFLINPNYAADYGSGPLIEFAQF